ncbi:hypothetical protein MBANPS3_001424 [Mucor bainieri]
MNQSKQNYPASFNRQYDYITNENGRLGSEYKSVYDGCTSRLRGSSSEEFDAQKYVQTCNAFLDEANAVFDYCQWCLDQLPQENENQPADHQSRAERTLWQRYISVLYTQIGTKRMLEGAFLSKNKYYFEA